MNKNKILSGGGKNLTGGGKWGLRGREVGGEGEGSGAKGGGKWGLGTPLSTPSYQVTWPWNERYPDLPTNHALAMGRLRSFVSKIKRQPELMQKYDNIIQEQVDRGVIEKIDRFIQDGEKHYLSHHAIITPQKPTTKVRVVYDASAKSIEAHKSLNECLYRGPVMINDLCGILIRFRLHTIALVADIEKAFHQLGLQKNQRDVTRFLWLKDSKVPSVDNDNIQEYRFCRVPFSVISSPFLLGATIESHLESYNTVLSNSLKRDIYVDNLITGTETTDDAVSMYYCLKRIFQEASMNKREWISKNEEVNQEFKPEDRVEDENVNVLGYTWNIKSDSILLKQNSTLLGSESLTKRAILKELASVFDPCGLLSPVLLRGKILLQVLWSKHLDWDDNIDSEDLKLWKLIKHDLEQISNCRIQRCLKIERNSDRVTHKLVCFCDASTKAYAAVIYLLQTNSEGKTRADLIFSKSRLAPVKGMTIPRLELMGVLIGVRCFDFVKSQLTCSLETIIVMTDSQCVLNWLKSDKERSIDICETQDTGNPWS